MLFSLQIQDEVEVVHGKNVVSPNVIVGMFLVSQGADIHIKNYKGVSPLQTRPTDVSQLMEQCRGHGLADLYYLIHMGNISLPTICNVRGKRALSTPIIDYCVS